MQYIAPTLQMGIGVAVYHEPVPRARLACFVVIWAALVIYSIDTWRAQGVGRIASGTPTRRA
jgi:chloramphenicol-sensitive protein RarD